MISISNAHKQFSAQSITNVNKTRESIRNILDKKDPRFIIIAGPCSFHDPEANIEYALKLKNLSDKFADRLLLLMRVYPEKARTSLGWKGYIQDPRLDGSDLINEGLRNFVSFMAKVADLDLPIATEVLSPYAYKYYEPVLSWVTIGARTAESQIHREIASNINMPVGFKNNMAGDYDVAINSIQFVRRSHTFLGLGMNGTLCSVKSNGNQYAHLVLRGGNNGPNYQKHSVEKVIHALNNRGMQDNIIIDCSHGNSGKNYAKQPEVFVDVLSQRVNGCNSIIGAMLESFLVDGNQSIKADKKLLQYGCSITDCCLDWGRTKSLIEDAYKMLEFSKQELVGDSYDKCG